MKKIKLLLNAFNMKGALLSFIFIFHFSFSYGQEWEWAKQGLAAWVVEGWAMGADKDGNAYLTGWFGDSVTFGSYILTSTEPYGNFYLVKYDINGNILWATQSTNGNYQLGSSIATDDSENVYVAGTFQDSVRFDTIKFSGAGGFLVKYDKNGIFKWAVQTNATNQIAVSTDALGYPYLTGNSYITKYTPTGNVIWSKIIPTGAISYSISAIPGQKATPSEYITGYFSDTVIFGIDTLTCSSTSVDNIFTVKYDTLGNVLWAKQSENSNFNTTSLGATGFWCVAADINGNAYISGFFRKEISFGPYTLSRSQKASNGFLAKYDESGNVKWANSIYSVDSNFLGMYSVVTDTNNRVYLSGTCSGNQLAMGTYTLVVVFSHDTLTIPIRSRVDLAMFWECDSSGHPLCGALSTGGGEDNNGVASDPTGEYVYFGGDLFGFSSKVIFGSDTLTDTASNEFPFVARWHNCDTIIATNISEVKVESEEFTVFPNPFTTYTTIQLAIHYPPSTLAFARQAIHYLELDDITGRKLKYLEFTGNEYELSAEGLAKGLYFVKILDGEKNVVGIRKVVVQ